MSRTSSDQYVNKRLVNGFDYKNQAWVINGIYQDCNHPQDMGCSCYGRLHKGQQAQEASDQEIEDRVGNIDPR